MHLSVGFFLMSKQTFDPITRSIRAAEAEARQVISATETAIASGRRKRNNTIEDHKPVFDRISACLDNANQLHDLVVASSHLVADNIAARSQRHIMTMRNGLSETAARMIELCNPVQLPQGLYSPIGALTEIDALLSKNGWITEPTKIEQIYADRSSVVTNASYKLVGGYKFSVMVFVQSFTPGDDVLKGHNKITVSVWEDRTPPPVWDMSYHEATSEEISTKGGKNVGQWTKQTDNAIIDYVASVLAKTQVRIPTARDLQIVPPTIQDKPSLYGTFIPRRGREGSEKFNGISRKEILRLAIQESEFGEQGEFIIVLSKTIDKAPLARYILDILQDYLGRPNLGAKIKQTRDGLFKLLIPSASIQAFDISKALSGLSV